MTQRVRTGIADCSRELGLPGQYLTTLCTLPNLQWFEYYRDFFISQGALPNRFARCQTPFIINEGLTTVHNLSRDCEADDVQLHNVGTAQPRRERSHSGSIRLGNLSEMGDFSPSDLKAVLSLHGISGILDCLPHNVVFTGDCRHHVSGCCGTLAEGKTRPAPVPIADTVADGWFGRRCRERCKAVSVLAAR